MSFETHSYLRLLAVVREVHTVEGAIRRKVNQLSKFVFVVFLKG